MVASNFYAGNRYFVHIYIKRNIYYFPIVSSAFMPDAPLRLTIDIIKDV
jgi:hypothetical protein